VSNERASAKLLNRTALTKLLVQKLKAHEAVIGGIGNSNFDLFAAGHRPQNFYMLGSMGLACPIALGVALGQPERGVIALEGDGSILMGLGCLATIANVKPRNLTIVIWDNGIYQITGRQQAAGGDRRRDRYRRGGARRRHCRERMGTRRSPFRKIARSPLR
jgi:thiamine pyrophosphate-dependent acetolactate synthase large subunit-like protein